MIKIVTVGVYGFQENSFFDALSAAKVEVLCDIRWRRGVRGSDYAFANHKRLKHRLETMGIHYIHFKDLAPSPEIRQRQIDADQQNRVTKRKRTTLSQEFVATYKEEILSRFDPQAFWDSLPAGTEVAALLCVERYPEACHRVLVADALRQSLGANIEHLLPG
jgi:uncharacterized protein (DUF488 family)